MKFALLPSRAAITLSLLLSTLLVVVLGECRRMTAIHAHDHHCIHETLEMQEVLYGPVVDESTGLRKMFHPQHEPISPQRYRYGDGGPAIFDNMSTAEQRRGFTQQAAANIRIVFSTADLDDNTKYCETAGASNPDFKGGTVTCDADTILTAAKKTILTTKVLPALKTFLEQFILVNPVVGNLVVSSSCPSPFTTPSSHTSTGVPNADFVLYVAGAPTTGSTVAWAGYCSLDGSQRPLTGRMNFSPKYIEWDDADYLGQRKLVRTVAHEVLHALGFSGGYIQSYFPSNPLASETRRGKTVSYVSGASKTLAKARTHFNCPSMNGPEIEDEGGGGTGGSHWERRNHWDDVMAGVVGYGMYMSGITLGMLEDSGKYFIDWTKEETPRWMLQAGCGVHTSKCDVAAGGLGPWFCNTDGDICQPDYMSWGPCYMGTFTSDLPSHFQYFADPKKGGSQPLMDYCPAGYGYSNRVCNDATNVVANSSTAYYARDGRCFKQSGAGARCIQSRCVDGVVQFYSSSVWNTCTTQGAVVAGMVCPDPVVFCTSDISSTTGATTTTTTTTSTTATTPTTTTTTTPTTTTTTTPTTTTTTPTTTTTTPTTTTTTPTTTTTTTTTTPTTTATTTTPTTTTATTAPTTTTTAPPSAPCTDYLLPTTSASPSSVFSVPAINNILTEHNKARKAVVPYATEMPMITWSQVLAAFAQEKVEELCTMTHSTNTERSNAARFGWSYVGENLAYYTASTFDPLNGAYPVKLWNDEVAYWTYPTCASGQVCGHYTQNIWAATTHVGCGGKRCSDGKVQWRCVYGPGGNYNGQNPYTSTTNINNAATCTNGSPNSTSAPSPSSPPPGSTTTTTTPPTTTTTPAPPAPRNGLVATLRILLFGPLHGPNSLRDLFFADDAATSRIDPLRLAVSSDTTTRLNMGMQGNCTATAVAPQTRQFPGENRTRAGIAIMIRISWFGNWSESTMSDWAKLIAGNNSSMVSSSERGFEEQAAYATGQSAAPVTSAWLVDTLAAVQGFQRDANLTVSASLAVGGVVVSTPRSSTMVDQCGKEGSGVLCTALVPSVIISAFLLAMFVVVLIIERHALSGGCSRFVSNLLGRPVVVKKEAYPPPTVVTAPY